MDKKQLSAFKDQLKDCLENELLPFCLDRCKDDRYGGYITHFDKDGNDTIDADGVHHAHSVQLLKKLDTVGAGDTTMSALGLCLAAGVAPAEAAQFANLAAAVTVQKLFQTGTASGAEILEIIAVG